MKFSENWLRQHVHTGTSRQQLTDTLTAIGLEVEQVTELGGQLDKVVVAKIVSAEPHPQADRLQLCMVDAGAGEPLQIVCGAPNARVGLLAPLAMVGARLGTLEIKPAKLRGVESNGMLCSAKELGLDDDASGLLELPADAVPGTALADLLGLPDASIELKLTPNRADCFGIRGIAFDVAAATGCRVEPLAQAPVAASTDAQLPVQLQAGADAPRYLGRVIEDVDASRPTPVWMAERLRRSGIRPLSLLVDITQYVMLELGQPLHAFDRDLMHGPVAVRHGREGERLRLLDGREVALDPDLLVVTDGDRPVALAGLMGGEDSKVGETTRNVFLESAHFAPAAIIGRGRRLGLHTDAGHRFERGVDPELPREAIEYATRLLLELAGGRAGPVVEAVLPQHLPQPRRIGLRRQRLQRVLGVAIDEPRVERILGALGLELQADAEGWQVTAPTRRFDLAIEEDLIEEIARIHGYDNIPASLPSGASRIAAPSETQLPADAMRAQIVARDYLEAINYAFVDARWLADWHLDKDAVSLANPLSAELGVMRTSLLPGLVAALGRNLARQQSRIRLFEIGKVFHAPAQAGEGGRDGETAAPRETARIAAVACGNAAAEQWGLPARALDFHDLKGDLQALAALAGAQLQLRAEAPDWAHPGRSARVLRVDGGQPQELGWIAQLHPRLLKALDIDVDVLAFELDLAPLQARALPRAGSLSRFPSVRRDLAVLVPEATPWSAIEASVRAAAGNVLRELQLFDRYQGKGIEPGFKSLAMGLILQEESRTLTDRDSEQVMDAVITRLASEHGARVRA